MEIVFTHNDEDGRAAAAIAKHTLKDEGIAVIVECDYSKSFHEYFSMLGLGMGRHHFWVFDYDPGMEGLRTMAEFGPVMMFDHHVRAQDYYREHMEEVNALFRMNTVGLVFDTSRCGASLAWEHFHGYGPAPMFVQLVQDQDLRLDKLEASPWLKEYLKATTTNADTIYPRLVEEAVLGSTAYLDEILHTGKMMHQVGNVSRIKLAEKFGMVAEVNGHKMWVANCAGRSNLFDNIDVPEGVDAFMTWGMDAQGVYGYGMYRLNPRDQSVNLLERFPGLVRGHAGACGGRAKNFTFGKGPEGQVTLSISEPDFL